MRATTPACLTTPGPLQHRAKLFYSCERQPLKIPVRGIYHDAPGRPRSAGAQYAAQFATFHALKTPPQVARRLLDNYVENILPRLPFWEGPELRELFARFYERRPSNAQPPPTGENTDADADAENALLPGFVGPMILAISSLTSRSQDFQKVAALSESLQKDAMRHADDLLKTTSLTALRCILMLVQLALLLPYSSNQWYLTGEAMRMAVSLGLHEEPELAVVGGPAQAEQRRKLFWAVSILACPYRTRTRDRCTVVTGSANTVLGLSVGPHRSHFCRLPHCPL